MKVVFIAGLFNGDRTDEARRNNVEIAQTYANALARHGIGFYCPHTHTMQLMLSEGAPKDDNFFRELNKLYFEKVCSAVLALPGWKESGGARGEVEEARKRNWPVFEPKSPEDLKEIVQWSLT